MASLRLPGVPALPPMQMSPLAISRRVFIGAVGTGLSLLASAVAGNGDDTCPECRGSGTVPCTLCEGTGYWKSTTGEVFTVVECPQCNVSGKNVCPRCFGTGKKNVKGLLRRKAKPAEPAAAS
eukprot:tig00020943_g16272.t1